MDLNFQKIKYQFNKDKKTIIIFRYFKKNKVLEKSNKI